MAKINYISLYFLHLGILFAQNSHLSHKINCDTAHFHFEDYVDSMKQYELIMGAKKNLNTNDERLKLAFYVALHRYPELHHTRITLNHKAINSTMQAQPSPDFLLQRKSNRSYRIFVNNNPDLTGINYEELSFNGLVGWIGHEFAHLIDYNTMKNRELIGFIAGYVFNKRKCVEPREMRTKKPSNEDLVFSFSMEWPFLKKTIRSQKNTARENKKNYLSEEEIIVDINRNCNH